MKIELSPGPASKANCQALIAGVFQDNGAARLQTMKDSPLQQRLQTLIAQYPPDCAKYGELSILPLASDDDSIRQAVLVGLGQKETLTLDKLRSLAANSIRAARKLQASAVLSLLNAQEFEQFTPAGLVKSIVEGTILGNYQFLYYKTEKTDSNPLEKFILTVDSSQDIDLLNKTAATAATIAENVNFARDLVNHPACYITPDRLALYADEIANRHGLELTVLGLAEMAELSMGAVLAVAHGSTQPPKFIALKYTGDQSSPELLAYIGKGITFDSGGISLKPSANMGEMKGDMAGGAAVLAAMQAIAILKPKTNILAIIPCAENMPSGCALKPGDIVKSMAGYTIEIISTDAEGRLLLADAVTYAKKMGATRLIDVATLTGACVVALGNVASGIITNQTEWCNQVLDAAAACDEKMWQLPAYEEYKEQIKSDIADLKNSGGRMAGTITAGLFIEKFAANTPWVHIDIAGTSDIGSTKGYQIKGATGAAVRTLIQLALQQDAANAR